MKTILTDINEKSLALSAKLIANGKLVAFPTETVYGLGADTFNEKAIAKIYLAKGRPSSNPLIVHVSNFNMISSVAAQISPTADKIIRHFMPAPLTVVLPKKKCVPDSVTAGLPTVAIRMPKSAQARAFINACGVPIAAPSANTSTRPSPTSAQDVYEDMKGKIPLILRGDVCEVGIESTVLSLVDEPMVLRPGIITPSEISQLIGKEVPVLKATDGKVNSPGVFFKHYAPTCDCVLVYGKDTIAVAEQYNAQLAKHTNPCIFCAEQYVSYFKNAPVYNMGATETDIARNYFALLRIAEKRHDCIIIMFYTQSEIGYSILNRMTKSVNGNIIYEENKI